MTFEAFKIFNLFKNFKNKNLSIVKKPSNKVTHENVSDPGLQPHNSIE